MKKHIIYSLLLLISYSCLKDYTREGQRELSVITIDTTKMKSEYIKELWDTLTIDPNPSQKGLPKPLTYEWEMDYKIVSTDPVLKYECKDLGNKSCRLKVSNEDGAAFYEFTLYVNPLYKQGVLVLSKYDGGSMLSFKRTDVNKPAYIGIYNQKNPDFPMGKTPEFVSVWPAKKPLIFLGTTDPVKVCQIEPFTLKVAAVIAFPEGAMPESAKWIIGAVNGGMIFLGGGTVYRYLLPNSHRYTVNKEIADKLPSNTYLSDQATVLHHPTFSRDDYRVPDKYAAEQANGIILYDNNLGRLLSYSNKDWTISELFPGTFTGMTAVRILACDSGQSVLLVIKDNTAALQLIYCSGKSRNLVLSKKVDAGGTNLTESSVMTTSSLKNNRYLYYSNANNIYTFNYMVGGFSTVADFQVAHGSEIKCMLIPEYDCRKLYVGTYNPDSPNKYKGDLYCFNIISKELLWKEEGIAGNITSMSHVIEKTLRR